MVLSKAAVTKPHTFLDKGTIRNGKVRPGCGTNRSRGTVGRSSRRCRSSRRISSSSACALIASRRSAETPTCQSKRMIQPRPMRIKNVAMITRKIKCKSIIDTLPFCAWMIASVMLIDRKTNPPSKKDAATKASATPANR